jgi:hypothetical protein
MEKLFLALYLIGLLSGCASSTTYNYYTISGDGNAIDSTGDARTERPVQVDTGVSAAASQSGEATNIVKDK